MIYINKIYFILRNINKHKNTIIFINILLDFFLLRAYTANKYTYLSTMANGRIEADPLFLGLTRPSMILGVTYIYAAMNAIGSVLAFIMTSNFVYLLVMMPTLHGIAYFICLKEPLMLELLLMKTSNFNLCANKTFHGGVNSYDVY